MTVPTLTTYAVNLSMSDQKHRDLLKQGFILYAFKAVKTDQPTPKQGPTVWLDVPNFYQQSTVSWEQDYDAYFADVQFQAGAIITGETRTGIDLGQGRKIVPVGAGYDWDVDDGITDWMTIRNRSGRTFTVGLEQVPHYGAKNYQNVIPSQRASARTSPMCAFDLENNLHRVIRPLQQVIMLFATVKLQQGSIVTAGFSDAAVIDASTGSADVEFTDDNRWKGEKVKEIPADDFMKSCIQSG
ncbi:hypothetical protein [Marinactinospora rubrisoli]|uniref:Uncharacterized protein n=1 Tax=Marinactinospora rubrisoli TaxID=2715399 RepID=A0ABW2KI23_9ACTN